MSVIEIEDKIINIVKNIDKENFIFEFLKIYDIPNATVTRLKKGTNNLSKQTDEIHLKNKLYFKIANNDLFKSFVEMEAQVNVLPLVPRYLMVTDFETLLAKDTKTGESLDIPFEELPFHFSFFLAWNGIEKVDYEKENPLDIKAAERFARLFDVLNSEIDSKSREDCHALNLFLMRLLFCLFAEDTTIFQKGQFTNGIKRYTSEDAEDMNEYILGLFEVLDAPSRENIDTIYKNFPYVNGQLFSESHKKIKFNKKARKLMIECGELLDWSRINPDIFGSMIQAIATEDSRSHLGMHYTSVPNIMKVINPLFLSEIKQQFKEIKETWNNAINERNLGRKKISDIRKRHLDQLSVLTNRIRNMKFFDPACGSGNFLIMTYKELRKLEIDIYKLINEISDAQMLIYEPIVTLSQFYGIEIDEFASDIAKLSLWIAEHQMNLALKEAVAEAVRPALPLKSAGDIRCMNALEVDWAAVCPHEKNDEVFIFGNPPYVGHSKQTKKQKASVRKTFEGIKGNGYLDYISCWFLLGSKYINASKSKLAFVSTNSICQGEQVAILWEQIFMKNVEIFFAYKGFRWTNNAKNKAGVTVVIIGLSSDSVESKYIYDDKSRIIAKNINAYLIDGDNILVKDTKKQLSNCNQMLFGNKPTDGGGLIFTIDEYKEIVEKYPTTAQYFKKYIGSEEFLNGSYRYCLWLSESDYSEIKEYPEIQDRISKIKEFRKKSKAKSTNQYVDKPYMFKQITPFNKLNRNLNSNTLVVPAVSSENRVYIPMGFINNKDTILSNRVYGIYDSPIYMLGVLMSKVHMIWINAVSGRLETRYSYSSGLCYNTFPIPEISKVKIKQIEDLVFEILDLRELDGRNLSDLYMPEKMPYDLKFAHDKLDNVIDKIYGFSTYDDNKKLKILLERYEDLRRSN
ncbi:class I SAM-dependent DNA methyltransferase [Enterococcus hulanensis]|uniref:class I SAM-dependent DNA methyltransferase n=1 Tax=Enterococcus hulanensis TaxID=2559929 RepID=UPI001A8FFDAD|nr:DNA methyltransferase [Enterococcus hulanensis]MBO0455698.1 class I SAM-dependent DNA methyltransferase [Enterococcus hulanensis]